MTQPRRKRASKATDSREHAQSEGRSTMAPERVPEDRSGEALAGALGPTYLATEHLPKLGLSPEGAAEVLADATVVYGWLVAEVAWRVQGELVERARDTWAERPVDRLNAALAFLERSGRALRIG